MKFKAYFKYFRFIQKHWDFRLAAFTIYHEIIGEKKYGIDTTGSDELKKLSKTGIDISHATIYMPVSYGIKSAGK